MKYIPIFLVLLLIGVCFSIGYSCRVLSETNGREYQIEATQDSLILYDGKRLVGSTTYDENKLTELILKDNQ